MIDIVSFSLIDRRFLARFLLAVSILIITACAKELVRTPVPAELEEVAEVVDMPGVRVWGDIPSQEFQADIVQSIRDEVANLFPRGPNEAFQYSALSLSGGGDHGAFGAGILKGWSESGTRPRFKIVTGTSTGAFIAPFALLGPEYDAALEEVYTQVTADEVYRMKSILGAYWRESLADNQPLRDRVKEYVTDEVIDAIAVAHNNGQRLLIGTTNLDAQRPVIWNMGAVANSKHPEAYAMFRKILVASAAIPVLFPPTFIDVEAEGEFYDEMHVDGGTVGQMFFFGFTIDWRAVLQEISGDQEPIDNSVLYTIISGDIDSHYDAVERRLVPIADRVTKTMIKVSAWSALYRMYMHAQIGGYDFKYVSLPKAYKPFTDVPYDPEEMRRMFRIGNKMGLEGDAWLLTPPGF